MDKNAVKADKVNETVKFYCEYENPTFDIKPSMTIQQGSKLIIQDGKSIKFSAHYFATDDKEVIEFLRKHIWYGVKLIEQEPSKE